MKTLQIMAVWLGLWFANGALADVNLYYDPLTGHVVLDSLTMNVPMASFSLQNDDGDDSAVNPPDFNPPADLGAFPPGEVTENTEKRIGWFFDWDGTQETFTGIACLGNIFPSGLTASGLDSFLTTASYFDLNRGIDLLNVSVASPDLDGNGVIDVADIQMLIDNDGSTSHPALDLNGNGALDYSVSPSGTITSDSDILIRALLCSEYGDANLDRRVFTDDLAILAGNFSTPSGYGQGDFDGSGDTSTPDLAILAGNFGFYNAPGVAVAAVPEPTSSGIWLLFLAIAAVRKIAQLPVQSTKR